MRIYNILLHFAAARKLACRRPNHAFVSYPPRLFAGQCTHFHGDNNSMTSSATRNSSNSSPSTSTLTNADIRGNGVLSLAASARAYCRQPSPHSYPPRCPASEMHDSAPLHNLEEQVYPKQSLDLPKPENTSLPELCALLHDHVSSFLESPASTGLLQNVQRQTATSLDVLKQALDTYELEEVALSYNGGKDCLVLLILWLVTLHRHFGRSRSATTALSAMANSTRHQETFPTSINTVYIRPQNPFAEVEDFVRESSRQYRLTLTTLTKPMKAAFADYLNQNPQVKTIFVGTRRTDPHGAALRHFDRTDGGWPDFMRCHPVIDWHYREIWAFIRHFNIPYCRLYDLGYTSLGGTNDTYPNPKLRTSADWEDGEDGNAVYKPAYELLEDDEERLGRPGGK